MKKILKAILIVFGILIIIGVVSSFGSGKKITKKTDPANGSTASETAKPTEAPSEEVAKIGDTIENGNGVQFVVSSVENTQSVGTGYKEVTTPNNFAVVHITITNNSKETYSANDTNFKLTNNDVEYSVTSDAMFSFDNFLTLDSINPGISKEYVLVYETPAPIDASWQFNILDNAFFETERVIIQLQ